MNHKVKRLERLEADALDERLLNARPDTLTGAELDRAITLHAKRLGLTDQDLVRLGRQLGLPPDGGLP